jgi:hypothetical protein
MRQLPAGALILAGLTSLLLAGCNSPMSSNPAGSSSGTTTATGTAKNTSAVDDAGARTAQTGAALRCAPSTGMLDACSGKTAGEVCALSGKRDGGWSFPGSCRSTLDGTGLACVPTPPPPPATLVAACTGQTAGASCQATFPSGKSFDGMCTTGRGGSTLFCGRPHGPPPAAMTACSGMAAGDGCQRPGHGDGGSKPGICRTGKAASGALVCGPATLPGVTACAALDAGSACTLDFGHKKHDGEGLSGSCVVPAAGGPATCLVSCTDVFRHHRHHGHGFQGASGQHGGPWWKHGHADAGASAP